MSLRNMNIAPRAFLGFAFIGALMLFLGVFALNQMSKIRAATEDITESSVPSIRALDEFTQLTLPLPCVPCSLSDLPPAPAPALRSLLPV